MLFFKFFYIMNINFVIGKYCNIIFIFITLVPIDSKRPKHEY